MFAEKKRKLREVTVSRPMTPKSRDQRILGELKVGIRIPPERWDGRDHPDGGREEAKEERAIPEEI
jgi:hypothetical protein